VHFFDAWTELGPIDLLRILSPALLLLIAIVIPGRNTARLTALGMAIVVPFLRELGVTSWIMAGWVLLWVAVAWLARGGGLARRPLAAPRGMIETGAIGFLLALALLALLLAAVARQDLAPEDGRRASLGIIVVGLGLLHLMIRRHARRATVALAALGLGLQVLDGAARGAEPPGTVGPAGWVLLATAVTVALTGRIAANRERHAGSAWVSDAHDLHD